MVLTVKIDAKNSADIHHTMTAIAIMAKKKGVKILSAQIEGQEEKVFDKSDPSNFMKNEATKKKALEKRIITFRHNLENLPIEEIKIFAKKRGVHFLIIEPFKNRKDLIDYVIDQLTK